MTSLLLPLKIVLLSSVVVNLVVLDNEKYSLTIQLFIIKKTYKKFYVGSQVYAKEKNSYEEFVKAWIQLS